MLSYLLYEVKECLILNEINNSFMLFFISVMKFIGAILGIYRSPNCAFYVLYVCTDDYFYAKISLKIKCIYKEIINSLRIQCFNAVF